MLQPVIVRPVGERYQLIAGERRLRAAIEAQLHEIPARVLELDDQRVCELAMVENLQREDLNAIEKATAFRNYLDTYGGTQEELAGRLGLDRSTLSNLLRLLDLPDGDPGRRPQQEDHARGTPGPCWASPTPRCRSAPASGWSPRTCRSARPRPWSPPASRPRRRPACPQGRRPTSDRGEGRPHVLEMEEHLRERFGTAGPDSRPGPASAARSSSTSTPRKSSSGSPG